MNTGASPENPSFAWIKKGIALAPSTQWSRKDSFILLRPGHDFLIWYLIILWFLIFLKKVSKFKFWLYSVISTQVWFKAITLGGRRPSRLKKIHTWNVIYLQNPLLSRNQKLLWLKSGFEGIKKISPWICCNKSGEFCLLFICA